MTNLCFLKLANSFSSLILATLGMALLISCVGQDAPSRDQSRNNFDHNSALHAVFTNSLEPDRDGYISFGGISFVYPKQISSNVSARTVDAKMLEHPTDRPDGVEPKHIQFLFQDIHRNLETNQSWQPELSVFPINGYSAVFANSPELNREKIDQFDQLGKILQSRSVDLSSIPFIRFIDSSPAIYSRVSYINFKNGQGVAYITQFNQEPALINNSKLLLVFQGMTNDRKYYVLMTFPISARDLPDSPNQKSYKEYNLPTNFYAGPNKSINEKQYDKYLVDVQNDVNNLPDNVFDPRLSDLSSLLLSLKVDAVDKELSSN